MRPTAQNLPDNAANNPAPILQRKAILFSILIALIICGTIRSAIATRLDSFDIDEPYHVTAGVSYARLADFRLNPEHPLLIKLWVGAFLTPAIAKTPQLRPLVDKFDERHYAAEFVFTDNDPDAIQHHVRIGMLALNAILLLAFSLAVWRAFGNNAGPLMAIGALTFLVIDPTIAAHLPVVLTDLPVTLLGSTAVLLAWTAFRHGRTLDVALAGLALGFALGAKHTALIVVAAVAAIGLLMLFRKDENRPRLRRLIQVFAVLFLAWICLWGFYHFRFNESSQGIDLFNRPLAAKIDDLHRPILRNTISLMARTHFMPRAYLWGLADILHVAVEGRITPIFFLGHVYLQRAPFYFFPTVVLLKVPPGLMALAMIGIFLSLRERTWSGREPLFLSLLFGSLLLLMLIKGTSGYAGMRHAQIVLPSLALAAAATFTIAVQRKSRALLGSVAVATALAMLSAIPVLRPWEYYNEIVGGKENAWRHLSDESTDSGQRAKEIADYYHRVLQPKGEIPYIEYQESYAEDARRGIPSMQAVWKAHPETDTSDTVTGTVMITAGYITPNPIRGFTADYTQLLTATPVERFGNLLIFRGTFTFAETNAYRLNDYAQYAEYSESPDLEKAASLMARAVEASPTVYYRSLELGNILIQLGRREEALRAYETARNYAPPGDPIVALLSQQIERVAHDDLKTVPTLRSPGLE